MRYLSQYSQPHDKVGAIVTHLANKKLWLWGLNFLPVAMQLLSEEATDRIPVPGSL